jgi:hypothetical protein
MNQMRHQKVDEKNRDEDSRSLVRYEQGIEQNFVISPPNTTFCDYKNEIGSSKTKQRCCRRCKYNLSKLSKKNKAKMQTQPSECSQNTL